MKTIVCIYNLKKKEEGHFLAQILQTRDGIISASYNENGNTFAVEHDTDKIDSETIQKIVIYLYNNSISNSEKTNKFINTQKYIQFLRIIIVFETFISFTSFIYILIGILTDCENCINTYLFFLLSLLILRITILLKNKIRHRNSIQTNYFIQLFSIPY